MCFWMDDEWTVVTEDNSLSAHYENTILITEGKPEILSLTEDESGWISGTLLTTGNRMFQTGGNKNVKSRRN